MAFSTQRSVSDGTLQDLLLEIQYIDREDINVFLDDVPQVVDVDYTWATDTMIHFTVVVPNGVEVLLQRGTSLANVLNIFTLGASFNNPTMDENFRQMLYIAQEAREGSTLEEVFTNLNMHGYKVSNMGPGTAPGDAINYQQYQDDALGAGNARAAAEAARDAAQGHATSASTSASTATTQAGIATTQAGLATTARIAAEAARDAALTAETNAETAETNAEAAAAAAAASAASINAQPLVGNALRFLRVNAGETALEYADVYTEAEVDALIAGIVPGANQMLVEGRKAAGTSAGTFTTGAWRVRELSDTPLNNIAGASLAANQITLPAGTYDIEARAPAVGVNAHQARLYNVTAAASLLEGSSAFTTAAGVGTDSVVRGRIVLAVTSVLEFQHACQTTVTTDGLGHGFAMGGLKAYEVYAQVHIHKR